LKAPMKKHIGLIFQRNVMRKPENAQINFQKNQRNKPHGAKRTAVKCEEEIEMKKSKRIVFTDDDGVPEP